MQTKDNTDYEPDTIDSLSRSTQSHFDNINTKYQKRFNYTGMFRVAGYHAEIGGKLPLSQQDPEVFLWLLRTSGSLCEHPQGEVYPLNQPALTSRFLLLESP